MSESELDPVIVWKRRAIAAEAERDALREERNTLRTTLMGLQGAIEDALERPE
jgi:hypothetical protein